MKNLILLPLLLFVNIALAQLLGSRKSVVKRINGYFYYESSKGNYTDSFWLVTTTFGTHKGNNILSISYTPNGDIKTIIVRDIDSVSKGCAAYKVFNNRGMQIKEMKREYDEQGRLATIASISGDLKNQCNRNDTCVTCKFNNQGDIIYFERRSQNDKNYILEKYKYEYEYWGKVSD